MNSARLENTTLKKHRFDYLPCFPTSLPPVNHSTMNEEQQQPNFLFSNVPGKLALFFVYPYPILFYNT